MDRARQEVEEGWEKLLNPDSLKANLVRASVYLASYELLKSAVIENPRGFINMGNAAPTEDGAEYKEDVVSLCPRDRLHASCLWFQQMGAITESDIALIQEIRRHRNDIAHELPKYLGDCRFAVNMQLLDSIQVMIGKIERWWIREIEMDCSSAYDHIERSTMPDSEIKSGRMIIMDWIHKVIYGQEEDLGQLLTFSRSARNDEGGGPAKTVGG